MLHDDQMRFQYEIPCLNLVQKAGSLLGEGARERVLLAFSADRTDGGSDLLVPFQKALVRYVNEMSRTVHGESQKVTPSFHNALAAVSLPEHLSKTCHRDYGVRTEGRRERADE